MMASFNSRQSSMSSPTIHPSLTLPDEWIWPSVQDPRRWMLEVYDALAAAPGFRMSVEKLYEHVASALENTPKTEEYLKAMRECVRFVIIQNKNLFETIPSPSPSESPEATKQASSTRFEVKLTSKALQEGPPPSTTMARSNPPPPSRPASNSASKSANQEIYCVCASTVDEGLMINCDGESCARQWFHVTCVSLRESDIPVDSSDLHATAKWFCPSCRQDRDVDKKGFEIVTRGSARLNMKEGGQAASTVHKRKADGVFKEDGDRDVVAEQPAKKKGKKKGETYCVCEDVEYGTMIQCDEKNCPTPEEWFHIKCVGLHKAPPKSVPWYCQTCQKKRDDASRPVGLKPLAPKMRA